MLLRWVALTTAAGADCVMADHYAVLGVQPAASMTEIRQAWIRAARRWHPDQIDKADVARAAQAEPMMLAVNEAWRVLGDAQLRASYDRKRRDRQSLDDIQCSPSHVGGAGHDVAYDHAGGPVPYEEPIFVARSVVAALVIRVLPWVLLATVVVTIFVVTAFASSNRSEREQNQRDPDQPTCVRILNDGNVRYVPCAVANNGVLDEIVALSPNATCRNPAAVQYEVAANRRLCILASQSLPPQP